MKEQFLIHWFHLYCTTWGLICITWDKVLYINSLFLYLPLSFYLSTLWLLSLFLPFSLSLHVIDLSVSSSSGYCEENAKYITHRNDRSRFHKTYQQWNENMAYCNCFQHLHTVTITARVGESSIECIAWSWEGIDVLCSQECAWRDTVEFSWRIISWWTCY